MKKWMGEVFSDVDGNQSSKRVLTLVAMGAFIITWAYNLWWGKTPDYHILDGLIWMVMAGFGAATVEKFARSRNRGFRQSKWNRDDDDDNSYHESFSMDSDVSDIDDLAKSDDDDDEDYSEEESKV